jgi:hypothetical protein
MIKYTLPFLLFMAVTNSLHPQNHERGNETLQGMYFGQVPPGMQSKVFAPGFISTEAGELNAVFCCDGSEFYFSRRGIPGKPSTLMVSKMINDNWSIPAELEFSGIYSDIDLFVTADGQSLIFCSKRPHIKGESEQADHDFWISRRDGNAWSNPVPFAADAISEYEDFYPVITANGNLYFNSQRGKQRGNNIYCAKYQSGVYQAAEKLPAPINSDSWEFDAYVYQDEKMILFSSTRPGGYGGADIYLSYRKIDGNWSEPKNLGPEINSQFSEYGSSISPDGKFFFYTSTRNGSEDIYWISAEILNKKVVETNITKAVKTPGEIFITYLKKNWDDIHDVIMRYHYEDPGLKGLVEINMNWRHGSLISAEILKNTTKDTTFGIALVKAMKAWNIPELEDGWSSTLPIRTSIKGSDDPTFNSCGILTGKVTDQDNVPISKAMVVLQGKGNLSERSDTLFTNRDGIFIQTLITPGNWKLSCSKPGYVTISLKDLQIESAHHSRQDIILE